MECWLRERRGFCLALLVLEKLRIAFPSPPSLKPPSTLLLCSLLAQQGRTEGVSSLDHVYNIWQSLFI